jgi:hypothetical protein
MKVFEASDNQFDITQVSVKTMSKPLDMSKKNVALHIGKTNSNDFLISFFECSTLFRGQSKLSNSGSQIVFGGEKTESSFLNEQYKSSLSKCALENNFFLFVTNTQMSEGKEDIVLKSTSIFINKSRWTDEFSPIFEFLKDLTPN